MTLPALNLYLFGPLRIEQNGAAVMSRRRKAQALLAYLAVTGQPHSRDALATLLWPEFNQNQARTNLRRELAELRRILGEARLLDDRVTVALNREPPFALDLTTFQHHLTQARQCTHPGHPAGTDACPACLPHLGQAAALYSDDFLAGFTLPDSPTFDDWHFFQTDGLRQTLAQLLTRLVRGHSAAQQFAAAIPHARRWVALDPLHEPAHCQLMLVYELAGQHAAALRQYESCVQVLEGELGVPPADETSAVYEQIRRRINKPGQSSINLTQPLPRSGDGEPQPGPANDPPRFAVIHTASSSPPPEWLHQSNIPPPPAPARPPLMGDFVGRQQELAAFGEQLATTNLAVISGMAGVGKTALTVALAELWQTQPLDISLAPDLFQQVFAKLRTANTDAGFVTLRTEQAMLVLTDQDGQHTNSRAEKPIFWHSFHEDEGVMTMIWKLAGFLAWQGQTELWQMLQTAQQTGVQPPPPAALFDYVLQLLRGKGFLLCLDDLHLIDDNPLVQQFVERLRALLSVGDVALIVTTRQTPTYLDGVDFTPLLGLNLADMRQLAANRGQRLNERWGELLHTHTEGNAQLVTLALNVLQRAYDPERTLQRLTETDDIERYLAREVDNGLSGDEREVMIAVAILLGYPGRREIIEAVANRRRLKRVLRDLTDSHLLTKYQTETGDAYSAHAIVRAFYYDLPNGRERLTMHRLAGEYYEREEPDELRAALHYQRATEYAKAATLATQDVLAIINRGQITPLQRLLEQFAAEQMPPPLWSAVNLAHGRVCDILGERHLTRSCYQVAEAVLTSLPASAAVNRLNAQLSWQMGMFLRTEAPATALDWLSRGLIELSEHHAPELKASLQMEIGMMQARLGQFAAALASIQAGLDDLPEDAHHLHLEGMIDLGYVYERQGQPEQAKTHILQALTLSQELHDDFRMISILINLGTIQLATGEWSSAVQNYEQALALTKRVGNQQGATRVVLEANLGWLYTHLGEDEMALTYLTSGLDLARKSNLSEYLIGILVYLASLHLHQKNSERAQPLLVEAEALALAINVKFELPELYRNWAWLNLLQDQPPAALARAEQAVAIARLLQTDVPLGASLRIYGETLLANQQPAAALAAFAQSLTLVANDPYESARTKAAWGRYLLSGLDSTQGTAFLRDAQIAFQMLGAERDLAAAQTSLKS